MTSNLPFSSTEQFDYQALLDEAIETLLTANEQLGPEEHKTDHALEELVAPLRKLKEAQAFFSSDLTVRPLSLQDFKGRGLKPASTIQKWMQTHHLYLIQVPITLKPSFGWAFTRLECGVVFEGIEMGPEPKVHDIYPDDVWSEILHVQTQLKLGLDVNLSFRAQLDPVEVAYLKLSGEAKAKLSAEAGSGAHLVIGPFKCDVHRPQVIARGREGSTAFWQLDGQNYVQQEEPYLAVVLRVPNTVKTINAQGRFIAYHKFDFLSAFLTDWKGMFREKLRSFFSNGIALEGANIWKNITT